MDDNPQHMFCGVDEAGRGPMMGPLVVACVYVEDDSALREMGVRDSKKLTPGSRESKYDLIIEAADDYEIVILNAEEIDSEMASKSLNDIELDMFAEACSRRAVDAIYADCPDVNTNRFSCHLSAKVPGPNVIAEHKADDTYPVVSAASILAKVTRDRMMEDISREFGVDVGSGYPSDEVTVEFVKQWIMEKRKVPPHVRSSWEPVKKLLMLTRNTRITDW